MPVARKNTVRKKTKKIPPSASVITKSYHPAGSSLFPDKIKKVKEVLSKSNFKPS
jgi:hypothetical protein